MADHSVMGSCLCIDRAGRKLLILGEACRSSFLNRGVSEEFDEMLFVSSSLRSLRRSCLWSHSRLRTSSAR